MAKAFTWMPIYEELADKLLSWEGRQPELIRLLQAIRDQGFIVTPLNDKNEPGGEKFVMKEIDPFTFFGTFNRGTKNEHRLGILAELKKFFDCKADLPTDFSGIPLLNNQRSWFISYQHHRKPDDVKKLWQVFSIALGKDPLNDPSFLTAYDEALAVRGVNVNLSMGLFWIRPQTFLNLDGTNRSYLKIPAKAHTSATEYKKTLLSVRSSHKESLPELSRLAYVAKSDNGLPPEDEGISEEESYWFVGAYWSSNDPRDQTQRFIDEGVWVNGYKDKFVKEVKQMKVGERIAIKSVGTQKKNLPFDAQGHTASKMTIKARGTIVANRGDGKTVEVEWDPDFEPKDWYHFTQRQTVWRVLLEQDYVNKQYGEKLVRFTFFDEPQDYGWFSEKWYSGKADEAEAVDLKVTDPYSIDDIIEEGVFLDRKELEQLLDRLRDKKNLILQGAPGVGKTFLAQRLAFALMEESDVDRIKFVQFHQSYSYEDFVRGYRPLPQKSGTFGLKNGVFFKFCDAARDDPDQDYVLIIDEINRGNLSQIFGELLMLIEKDKRTPKFAVPLMYTDDEEQDFYVPDNLYIIGLMNLADRSLAIVDYALRRRFAFKTLEPKFNSSAFTSWLSTRSMEANLIDLIVKRLTGLNEQISNDEMLGPNYAIGHSYFCPGEKDLSSLDRAWYDSIIETEIVPLIQEYWFDNRAKQNKARDELLAT